MTSMYMDLNAAAFEPPFRGHVETTHDALLIFEAAKRGMVPRITRRLTERERGMIASGAVFVFDEHESGIKRWTDGFIWSPSRILGNFLVYREVDSRPNSKPKAKSKSKSKSKSRSPKNSTSPDAFSPNLPPLLDNGFASNLTGDLMSNPLGSGELRRSNGDVPGIDRHRERQLVGSLTSAYAFKQNGMVKKTMSIKVNGYSQHLISYYSMADIASGKLRTPSSVPEIAALEISPDYLHKNHFRFPPATITGLDNITRYSRDQKPEYIPPMTEDTSLAPLHNAEMYDYHAQALRIEPPHSFEQTPRERYEHLPSPIPIPTAPSMEQSYYTPGSANSGYSYMAPGSSSSAAGYYGPMSPTGQSHPRSDHHSNGARATRPASSSRSARYEPYNMISPRAGPSSLPQHRRGSGGHPGRQQPNPHYDVKPVQSADGQLHYPDQQQYYGSASAQGSLSAQGSSSAQGSISAQGSTSAQGSISAQSYGLQHSPMNEVSQIPTPPYANWHQPLPSGYDAPRHGTGHTPPSNNDMPLHPIHSAAPPHPSVGRPSTAAENGPYQAAPPPSPHQQWSNAAHPSAWDTNAPGPHGPGSYAYHHHPHPPPAGPQGLHGSHGPPGY